MRLLPMSFAGAVMILAVIVIRALLINRLPKKTFLILWGVVLARLLIPFSLPSKFSIYSLVAQTIDSFNTSETRGRELSHGLNYQKLGKELMTQDEIAVMDGGKCILQLRGVRPFFSDKFDITKHPKYKYLSDADPKNAFDMEKHIKRRPAIVKPDEVFDYYEIDIQEDAAP